MAQEGNVAAKVDSVFSAVAKGDASETDALLAFGEAIVPAVAAYLTSSDQNVRAEAVALLAALQSEAATKALLPSLADSSAEVRERAARAVLAQVLRAGPFAGLDAAVADGLAAGEPSAPLLLLGAFSSQADDVLRGAADSGRPVKLTDAGLPVAARLPAQVALSRLGDDAARSGIGEAIAGGDLAELLFLLDVLPLLDDPSTIQALAEKALRDQRPIANGLPSGAEPSRRVTDRAVEAFAVRLQLKLSFPLEPTRRYSAAEIAELHAALKSSIPQ